MMQEAKKEAKDSSNSRPARNRRPGQQANSADAPTGSAGVFAPSEPKKMKVEMKVSADTPSEYTVRNIYDGKSIVNTINDQSWAHACVEDSPELPDCLSPHHVVSVIAECEDIYNHKFRWALLTDLADAADSLINQFVVSEHIHNECFASNSGDVDRKSRRMLDVEIPNLSAVRDAPVETLISCICRVAYAAEVTTMSMMTAERSRYDDWSQYGITLFDPVGDTLSASITGGLNDRIKSLLFAVDQRVRLLCVEGLISHATYADVHEGLTVFRDKFYQGTVAELNAANMLYSFAVARAAMRLIRNVQVMLDVKLVELFPVGEEMRDMARRPVTDVL